MTPENTRTGPRKSCPIPCHAVPFGPASRTISWQGHGTTVARYGMERILLNKINKLFTVRNGYRNAAVVTRCEMQLILKGKARQRPVAQLRHVCKFCKFSEAQRAETGSERPDPLVGASQEPDNGTARSATVKALRAPLSASGALSRLLMTLAAVSGAMLAPVPACADAWGRSGLFGSAGPQKRAERAEPERRAPREGWQFAGMASEQSGRWRSGDWFERSVPGGPRRDPATFRLPTGTKVDQLFALIAFAEAPKAGYDAIHHSARKRPRRKPTQMTLGQITSWVEKTPGQHHAIGRYQFIPSTFRNLQRRLGLPDGTRFTAKVQDRMASVLLADAGYNAFRSGDLGHDAFMDRLARIWAGLPLRTGKSAYHGHAGNRATISRAFYAKQVKAIFGAGPKRQG